MPQGPRRRRCSLHPARPDPQGATGSAGPARPPASGPARPLLRRRAGRAADSPAAARQARAPQRSPAWRGEAGRAGPLLHRAGNWLALPEGAGPPTCPWAQPGTPARRWNPLGDRGRGSPIRWPPGTALREGRMVEETAPDSSREGPRRRRRMPRRRGPPPPTRHGSRRCYWNDSIIWSLKVMPGIGILKESVASERANVSWSGPNGEAVRVLIWKARIRFSLIMLPTPVEPCN